MRAKKVPCAGASICAAVSSSAASNALVAQRIGHNGTRPLRRHGHIGFKKAYIRVKQTQNLVSAAQEGRLDEALKDTSADVKDR